MQKISNTTQKGYLQWLKDLALLFGGILAVYLLWLGSHPLLTPDEARYAEIAREMLVKHDYITPRLNDTVFLDKPILYYWLQISAIKMFGLNEWALRFWPVLLGVIGCLFNYVAGRLLFSRRVGILAAVILATCPLYFGMAHYANLDLELAVFVSASLYAFIISMQQIVSCQQLSWLLAAYLCAALAILTKGLIGILFPMMIIGCWLLFLNRWRLLSQMYLLTGSAIIMIIVIPWYYLVQKANPDFLNHFFLDQQFTRFLSKDFNNAQPMWFYLPIILFGIFPWLLLLPQAIVHHLKLIRIDKQQYNALLFLLLWPLLIFLFFSIPNSKTIGYITPVIPPLALLIGYYLDYYLNSLTRQKFKIVIPIFIGLVINIALVEVALIASIKVFEFPSIKPLAMQIMQLGNPADEVVAYYKYYQDLPFYTQRRVTVVMDWDNPAVLQGDNWRREISDNFRSPAARQWLIKELVFWRRWRNTKRMFVLVDERYRKQFEQQAKPYCYRLMQYQNVILYTNKL